MAMVIPRSFSSGALSIESKVLSSTSIPWLFKHLVMAAVSVVLPWSTWPMVPTFKCGLVRSNFSLDTGVFLSASIKLGLAGFLQYGLGNARRHRRVFLEFHRVCRAALGRGTHARRVTEHVCQRHL